jgi:hypothetical protein
MIFLVSFELASLEKKVIPLNEAPQSITLSFATSGKISIQLLSARKDGIYRYKQVKLEVNGDTTVNVILEDKVVYSDNFPYAYTNGQHPKGLIIIQNLESKTINFDLKGVLVK